MLAGSHEARMPDEERARGEGDEEARPGDGFVPRRLFGRRKGVRLSPTQERRTRAGLERLSLDLAAPCPADPRTLFAAPVTSLRMEVGFGGGEHLAHELAREPATGFIGAEPFLNGITALLTTLEERAVDGEARHAAGDDARLRLHRGDAGEVMDWLPPASLARIDVLYPDPWPKLRHRERRFVRPDNLARMARALKPGGELRIASDVADYITWARRHADAAEDFALVSNEHTPWADWPGTRYEAKAYREGRSPAYLIYRRT